MTHSTTSRIIKDMILIVAGILSAGLGLKGFLLSSRFIDGGVTGVSMLLASILHLPLPWLILVINLPFVILGYQRMGRQFAIRSVLAIAGLSLCLAVVPYPDVTPDLLLTATFGGFFIGAGIGLAMRGGAVLDGTEIAALLISRKSSILKVSDVILVMNVLIFGAAAFFLTIESALYSMITYFAASKTIDFLVHGIEEYTAVIIISNQQAAVRDEITRLGWGVTTLKGEEGFGKRGLRDKTVNPLYVVVTRLEVSRLTNAINRIDDKAFIIKHAVDDVVGGKVRSRAVH
ncbi:YitT family protein [Spirosoma taeanense]|uniref:YitT family protein n=1 Tax=Spirosoma taeanense TaxID=2735870 RepID=A0A6M5Y970_9BACT|nr:YitT family protein [Spirosoma taeanense]QJW90818.1 YitT family protein [Spirosoma taeanense]